jgi:cytochrome P450
MVNTARQVSWIEQKLQVAVSASHYVVYHSPELFRDPMSFAPVRWTGDERYASDERMAFQIFSVGTRDCLGKK